MMTAKEIKFVRSLQNRKARLEHGVFVVEGEKMVDEALASGFKVRSVYRKSEIGEKQMSQISAMSSPSPALAVVEIPEFSLPENPFQGLSIALDSVRDPGNLGTIIRLADWFGVKAVYATPDTVEAYNPKVIQASMGSIFRVKVIYCPLVEKIEEFKAGGAEVYGTFLAGENIYKTSLAKDALVVLGNESNGVSHSVMQHVSKRITIPSFGSSAESLNVAVAAAIVISECKRS